MNHVGESQVAWDNAVKAAKANGGNRGLGIWPGDQERVKLEDLPVLPSGWVANLKGRAWDIILVDNDKMLRQVVRVGRAYALGFAAKDPEGFFMVVEQG